MVTRLFIWRVLATLVLGAVLAVLANWVVAAEEPSVVITNPTDGSVIEGSDIVVEIAVSDLTIRPPLQPVREENTGYVIYFLDVPPAFDQPTPLGEDSIIHSGRMSETFLRVAPGPHTIYLCLAYDDHTCIDATLTDSVQITVGEPSPTEVPTAEPTPESTPEPPSETPEPAEEPPVETPTPAPTPEPSPEPLTQTPTPAATPEPTLTPPPDTPRPTVRPLPPTPLLATGTPNPGLAPGTLTNDASETDFGWVYVGFGAVAVVMLVGLGLVLREYRAKKRR